MTVVVGTAGHIDHGKTSLLRVLTGIDADRLPEEQRRGMTIDVGYAHMGMDDGAELDFVDVPGHDRLIGNMLVGAGEIDAAMLVVAADDGPRPQTIEHLELLDALGVAIGLAVVTKIDLVVPDRRDEVVRLVRRLLDGTSLRGAPILAASSVSLEGLAEVRAGLARVRSAVLDAAAFRPGPPRLAVDRAFSVRGRGTVVTGSLRGGALARGDVLRIEPSNREVRIRELQVHNVAAERVDGGGRVALNVVGADSDTIRRGDVLSVGPGVERTQRLLVALRPAVRAQGLRHGLHVRLHIGTEQVDGTLDLGKRAAAALPDGGTTAMIRLDRDIAAAFGDRFVLRRPSPPETLAGGRVLDPQPPSGVSRRRIDAAGMQDLATANPGSDGEWRALLVLHGALPGRRHAAWSAVTGRNTEDDSGRARFLLADDVSAALATTAVDLVAARRGVAVADLRVALAADARRRVTLERDIAAVVGEAVLDELIRQKRLVRDGDRVLPEGSAGGPSAEQLAAMDRLEAALAVPGPPSLRAAALAARCPVEGVRALEAAGRIVRVEDDLAWAAPTWGEFEALALRLASAGPLSPAAFRDATGTSRRFALAILEDLDRRAILRRTADGHVPGPRAATHAGAASLP